MLGGDCDCSEFDGEFRRVNMNFIVTECCQLLTDQKTTTVHVALNQVCMRRLWELGEPLHTIDCFTPTAVSGPDLPN